MPTTVKSKYGESGRFITVSPLHKIDTKYIGSSTGRTGQKYHNFLCEDETLLTNLKTNHYFKGVEIKTVGTMRGVRIGILDADAKENKKLIQKSIRV